MTDTLIISTHNNVLVWTPEETRVLRDGCGPFFGLTWDHWQRLYVGARYIGQSGENALLIFDKNLEFKEKHWLPNVGQIHQIIYWNGGIYLTDTTHNHVWRWDTISHEMESVYCPKDKHPTKACHLNALWWDGDLFYVGDLWGTVTVFTHDWCVVDHFNFEFELHDAYVEDGKLIVCASDKQSVFLYDLTTDEGEHIDVQQYIDMTQKRKHRWQSYTRGIARSQDYFYVGCSSVEDQRTHRQHGGSAIVVFDNDWQFIECITLPDTGGFHDIRVLGDDRAHNGIVWK